ncbi:MAG TPA: hypothetical protein VMZ53_11400 [Kofleriaceae bacterium]|nr:hypothetical protein [Kofleriaceae bacterium]
MTTNVDFTKCDQPDELLQLAWNAGLDRRTIIREGSDAARLLLAGEKNEIITLFWPVPRAIEAVDRWAGDPRDSAGNAETMRHFASAVVPGCVLGAAVAHWFVSPHLSENNSATAMFGIIFATIVVLGVVFKVLIGASIRRQVARLDESKALEIVLARLRRGMVAKPRLIPVVVKDIRRGFAASASDQAN